MEEIKPMTTQQEIEKPKTIIDEMKELKKFKEQVMNNEIKVKKLKIPRKAKVKGRQLKKGYVGVLRIDENRNITAEKQKVSGFSYKASDGLYHTTDGREILFWNGKFPIIIQPSWKDNPMMIDSKDERNETYGQPYIKAKMLADTIKVKAKGGGMIIWLLIAGAALFGINYLMGGNIIG